MKPYDLLKSHAELLATLYRNPDNQMRGVESDLLVKAVELCLAGGIDENDLQHLINEQVDLQKLALYRTKLFMEGGQEWSDPAVPGAVKPQRPSQDQADELADESPQQEIPRPNAFTGGDWDAWVIQQYGLAIYGSGVLRAAEGGLKDQQGKHLSLGQAYSQIQKNLEGGRKRATSS